MQLNNDWQLSAPDFEKLKVALSSWPLWAEKPPSVLRPLSKGLTNSSYLIAVGNASLVLRINSPQSGVIGLDRTREIKLLSVAGDLGFAPKLVYADPNQHFLLTEFIAGDQWSLEQSKSSQSIVQLSNLLRCIHQLKPMGDFLSIDKKAERYWSHSHSPKELMAELKKLQPEIERHQANVNANQVKPCLCHNDLVPENIIYTDKMMYALDWEYASMGDPFFDLAVVVEEHKLDQQAIILLLESYLDSSVSQQQIDYLYHYRVLYCYLAILWYGVRYPNVLPRDAKAINR